MSTKVVALCLEEIGREILCTVAIIPAERSAEGRKRDTPYSTLADNVSPTWLRLVNGLVEEIIEEQVFEIWVVAVSLCDILQEY